MVHEIAPSESAAPDRRELRRARRRRELLDLGLELVRREGLDGLTIHSLAAEAELTAGAIYRYFPSMEAIVAHLEIHALERMADVVEVRLAAWSAGSEQASGPPEQASSLARLLITIEAYLALQEEEPAAFALIRTLVGDPRRRVPDELVGEVLPSVGRLLSLLTELFREAQRVGALEEAGGATLADSPEARAVTWWATMQGLLQLDKFTSLAPIPVDLGALARGNARALLRGWGASSEDLESADAALAGSGSMPETRARKPAKTTGKAKKTKARNAKKTKASKTTSKTPGAAKTRRS